MASWPRDRGDRASPAPAGADARGDPAGRVRPRRRRAAGRAARAADRDPRARQHADRNASRASARPRRPTPWARFVRLRAEADALIFELIEERRAEQSRAAARCPLDAARRASRGRLADVAAGASRRADDAAGGRSRDHRIGACVGVRAPAREPAVLERAGRRDRRGERRRIPDRDGAGDASPPAGAPERGAAAGQAARSRSAAGAIRPGSAWSPTPTCASRSGHLSRPVRVPARALPRRDARHLHLDPVRRRAPALPRRELRPARDEARAAGRALPQRDGTRRNGLEFSRRRAITLSPGAGATTVLRDRELVAV